MKSFFTLALTVLCIWVGAQNQPLASSAMERINSGKEKLEAANSSIYAGILVKNIGPTVQSGRVVDIEVNPDKPHIFYVAYASGGLWKTINNGASFTPLFQQELVMTIGDFDVNWETNEIWVGTGEVNSSRSSYAGVGMFYSKDGGETWEHKGLGDTHHIGKVIIDKKNIGTIYVASLGHLYSSNASRGVFKTNDNGENWFQILSISPEVGVVDLIQDANNPSILYAASWERTRRAWNFVESGEGSAIHKTTDGGNTWMKITGDNSGFPATEGTGRIGLTIANDGNSTVLYALLDNYDRRPAKGMKSGSLSKDDFKTMSKEAFLRLEKNAVESYLRGNNFPEKYTAESVIQSIKEDKIQVTDLASYLEDANRLLFDTPVIGAELYRSDDEGKTWYKTHDEYLERVYNSYGYYFGLVRVAPGDVNTVYIGGVPLLRSRDGGKTFDNVNKENVHADHHALWINPTNNNHIINGNDGGVNISYDGGDNYFLCNSPTVGQFYAINVDYKEDYNVYGGLQDNGVWMGSHKYDENVAWHQSGHYSYKSIMGGDGMQIQIDTRDNNTVYTGFQFGNYFRINLKTEDQKYITPKHNLGESPYRWNWQSPILLSSHNQDIVYMGANTLLRSMDQGENFRSISPDLTQGGRKGDVAYGTITTISESTSKFGFIYTGSDDGKIYRTDDGGANWNDISNGLPGEYWVSRVVASQHDENVVYTALNGYRWDDFRALVYRSDDKGKTWKSISSSLPMEPVNVIKEDPFHKEILYVGTDHGTYISHDTGNTFHIIANDIPKVAVHDLVVQTVAKHLLVGTHGRSIYKIELDPIYAKQTHSDKSLIAKENITRRASRNWGNKNWLRKFNVPNEKIFIYSDQGGTLKTELQTKDGKVLKKTEKQISSGFSYYDTDFTIDAKQEKKLRDFLGLNAAIEAREDNNIYLAAGEYQYVFQINGQKTITNLTLK